MASFNKNYPISSSDKSMVSIQFAAPAQWTQQDQLAMQLLDTIVSQRLRGELREKASGIYALGFSQMLAKNRSLTILHASTLPPHQNVLRRCHRSPKRQLINYVTQG